VEMVTHIMKHPVCDNDSVYGTLLTLLFGPLLRNTAETCIHIV